MIAIFFYYVFYASAVFIYGAGIDRAVSLVDKRRHLALKASKMIICTSSTSALSYLFVNGLLVPADLGELYPFAVVLIFSAISVFTEAIIRITAKVNAAEFGVTLLFIFIALSESASLSGCVFISCVCVLSFFLCIPLLYVVSRRIELEERRHEHEKTMIVLASVAVIAIILLCWNVSWLNKGVFRW